MLPKNLTSLLPVYQQTSRPRHYAFFKLNCIITFMAGHVEALKPELQRA